MIFNAGRLHAIGFVRKPHGFNGGLRVVATEGKTFDISEPVFFLIDGKPVPFFIDRLEGSDEEPVLFLEDINSEDLARTFQGKQCLQSTSELTLHEQTLEGWTVLHTGNVVGVISAVLSRPQQLLLEVRGADSTYLIPLAEDWILEIDEASRELNLDLPEGILDINE